MKTIAFALLFPLVLLLSMEACFAPCGVVPPPPPEIPKPPKPKTDPGNQPPSTPPTDKPDTPSTGAGGSPGTPQGRRPRPRGTFGYAGSWNAWWNLNREYVLGLRHSLKGREAMSGGRDPMPAYRASVRTALREVAEKSRDERVKAEALIALGRAGGEYDALFLLKTLRAKKETSTVRQAAAIGLSGLPAIDDPEIRDRVRQVFEDLLGERLDLPDSNRRCALLALSLRAGGDPALVRSLGTRFLAKAGTATETAALMLACGLARDPMLAPYLSEAVKSGELRGDRLHDIARSHALFGLALCGDEETYAGVAEVLLTKKVPVHTRRAAALALGHIMRVGKYSEATRAALADALVKAFDRDRDVLVRGFSALALGEAGDPAGVDRVRLEFVSRQDDIVRPYCALSLALAVRGRDTETATKIRKILYKDLKRAKGPDHSASACIAVGLAGADEAEELLLYMAKTRKGNPEIRGAALEALGLLGKPHPKVTEVMEKALGEAAPAVNFGAALGLGLVGDRFTGRTLVEKMTTSTSQELHAHLVIALAHLGSTAAIDPLLELLTSPRAKDSQRKAAATALGLLVDRRDRDPLFELDAVVNPYGLTVASRELVAVY